MKLITFNDDKNISYFGECRLQFFKTKEEKCLKLIMLDKEPQETITSPFDKTYICKNNFLCAIDQQANNAFVCAFSTKESCEKIYNAIVKVKLRQSQLLVSLDEEEIFKSDIFIPFIKQVQAGVDGHEDLRSILLDFVNSLDSSERLNYLNIMAEILLVPSLTVKAEDKDESLSAFNTSGTSFNSSMNYNMRKRPCANISYKETDEECIDKKRSSRRKSNLKVFDEPSPINSPNDIIYDIVECVSNGNIEKRILVFASKERKNCYEFILHFSNTFKCVRCFAQAKVTLIQSSIHDDGSKIYNFNTHQQHVCQPINYLPSNYQSSLIVKSPNFKFTQYHSMGRMRSYLIIFVPEDKNLCYRFGFDSNLIHFYCLKCKKEIVTVSARFIRHDGKNAIELGHSQHRCQPQKYISDISTD